MVKGLVLEAPALEIARTANHWLAVVPGVAAELLSPIWAIILNGESGNYKTKKRYTIHTGALGI